MHYNSWCGGLTQRAADADGTANYLFEQAIPWFEYEFLRRKCAAAV
jgi:hypothetical protein